MPKVNENSFDKIEIEIDEQILKDIHEAAQKLNPEFMKLSKEDLRRVGENMSAAFRGFNRAPICFDSDSDCPMCEKGIPKDRILIIGTPSSATHTSFAKLTEHLKELGGTVMDMDKYPLDRPVLGLHADTIIIDDEAYGMLPRQSMKSMLEAASFKPMLPWDEMEEPEDKPHHCHRKCKHQDRGFCLKKGGCNK